MAFEFQSLSVLDTWAVQLYTYLPKLGLGLLILVAGVLIGRLSGGVSTRILRKLGIDRAAHTTGISDVAKQAGIVSPVSRILGKLVEYVIYLVAIMMAFDVFGLYVLTSVLTTIITYIPKIFGAVTILVVGFIVSGFTAEIVKKAVKGAGVDSVARNVGVGVGLGELAEGVVRYFLYIAVVLIALDTLQISMEVLGWLFTITAAALALSGALILVLSAKDIGPNIAAGLFIDSNKILKKGDKVTIKDYSGKVEEIGSIFTTIKTRKGLVKIPNNQLMKLEIERH